jgi:glycosyltransferase involved in cell wall biosynthesis
MSAYQPLVTVAIPSYNAAKFIRPTLDSLSAQTYRKIEVVLVDDGSTDDTVAIVEAQGFERLIVARNEKNLGCCGTIQRCATLGSGEILYFLCHDDILSPVAVERAVAAFANPAVGATTRPYYFFEGPDYLKANRAVRPLAPGQDVLIDGTEDYPVIHKLVETLGQLSGLGFRRSMMTTPFSDDVFTVHGQAFLGVLRDHPVVYIGDYILGVRTETSQSRTLSKIYVDSPLQTWADMFYRVFPERRFDNLRRHCLRHMATGNDVGLVQLKTTSGQRDLLREIRVYLKVWPGNWFRPTFWFWVLITVLIPSWPLRRLIDRLKQMIGPTLTTDATLYQPRSS